LIRSQKLEAITTFIDTMSIYSGFSTAELNRIWPNSFKDGNWDVKSGSYTDANDESHNATGPEYPVHSALFININGHIFPVSQAVFTLSMLGKIHNINNWLVAARASGVSPPIFPWVYCPGSTYFPFKFLFLSVSVKLIFHHICRQIM
jgi:hypothetical protein